MNHFNLKTKLLTHEVISGRYNDIQSRESETCVHPHTDGVFSRRVGRDFPLEWIPDDVW